MLSYSSSQSFVQRTFPPIIGSLTSPSVELICQKNNLTFVELLRPFCALQLDHRLKDPSGSDHYIKQLQICIQDVNERPPQPTLARKLLNEAVASVECDVTRAVPVSNGVVDIPADCPWFRAWTEAFLQVQFPSEHEFTKHLLGCMLVTSSSDPPELLQNLLQNLQQMQATAPARLPKWFCPAIFKFFVLVHDPHVADKTKALNTFNSLKTSYGAESCYFLELNSRDPKDTKSVEDYWSPHVNRRTQDVGGSGASSSPRTPAELSGIASMATSSGGIGETTSMGIEGVQDLPESTTGVLLHPLSPDLHVNHFGSNNDKPGIPLVNANVWSGCSGNRQFGQCLAQSEVDGLSNLVRSVVVHALLPHVEKQIFILNDVVSNKKGMSRSLFSATKRLFGSSKPGTPGSASANSVVYAFDAPELQLRRLGDLYFMFTYYSLAFQTYYAAKRELGADQAWLYYAGALEMAALSAFMAQEPLKKGIEYIEEAITTYLSSCKMPQFATRATLLGAECLKERAMYGEAASHLIRMTSEDSDLRSALLLEQAAYCFLLAIKPRMHRKYALHMILAGHRFSKAGQKTHALRCYRQALQVYDGRGWSLADDHLYFTIGRLAGHLGLLNEGSNALGRLLLSNCMQSTEQQKSYLMEYLNMQKRWENEEGRPQVSNLALPTLEYNSTRVITLPVVSEALEPDSVKDAVRWAKMEELAVTESHGPPMIFRPSLHVLSSTSLNLSEPILAVNEWLTVEISIRNPLQIPIALSEFRLLWNYKSLDGRLVDNEHSTSLSEAMVHTQSIHFFLTGQEARKIFLRLSPLCPGKLVITGIAYLLAPVVADSSTVSHVAVRQELIVRGPRLKPKKDKPNEDIYADDKRLNIIVVPSAPLLTVNIVKSAPDNSDPEPVSCSAVEAPTRTDYGTVNKLSSDVLCGELDELVLTLENLGNAPLSSLYVVSDSADNISLPNEFHEISKVVADSSVQDESGAYYLIMKVSLKSFGGSLKPGQKLTLPFWCRAPDLRGISKLGLLFYYTNSTDGQPRHRVSRFTREMRVHDALEISIIGSPSPQCPSDSTTDSMNLCLTARNLNATNDQDSCTQITLGRLVVASRLWALKGTALSPKDVTLRSQETIFFLAHSRMMFSNDYEISEVGLVNATSATLCQLTKDFLLRKCNSEAVMTIGILWEGTITCFKPSNFSRYARGLALLVANNIGTLTTSPLPTALLGSSNVPSLFTIFGPDRKEKSKQKRQPADSTHAVAYSLTHEDTVHHSFDSNRVCSVEVCVSLRNSTNSKLKVAVNSVDAPLRPPLLRTQLYTPHSAAGFVWTGRARALVEVPERSSESVVLRAIVTSPGVYDLASRVTVAIVTDAGLVPLSAASESPVVVLSS